MPTRDNALVRKNNRLVVIVFLFSLVDTTIYECSFHYIKNVSSSTMRLTSDNSEKTVTSEGEARQIA